MGLLHDNLDQFEEMLADTRPGNFIRQAVFREGRLVYWLPGGSTPSYFRHAWENAQERAWGYEVWGQGPCYYQHRWRLAWSQGPFIEIEVIPEAIDLAALAARTPGVWDFEPDMQHVPVLVEVPSREEEFYLLGHAPWDVSDWKRYSCAWNVVPGPKAPVRLVGSYLVEAQKVLLSQYDDVTYTDLSPQHIQPPEIKLIPHVMCHVRRLSGLEELWWRHRELDL